MSTGFPSGTNGTHHDISHQPASVTAQDRIEQIHCEQLAAFLQTLKAVPEGSGTMLDNTLVVYFNEVSNGNAHGTDNMPLLMFGGKSLGLQTGQHLHFNGRYMNDVAAVGTAFGNMKTFGDTGVQHVRCQGSSPEYDGDARSHLVLFGVAARSCGLYRR